MQGHYLRKPPNQQGYSPIKAASSARQQSVKADPLARPQSMKANPPAKTLSVKAVTSAGTLSPQTVPRGVSSPYTHYLKAFSYILRFCGEEVLSGVAGNGVKLFFVGTDESGVISEAAHDSGFGNRDAAGDQCSALNQSFAQDILVESIAGRFFKAPHQVVFVDIVLLGKGIS